MFSRLRLVFLCLALAAASSTAHCKTTSPVALNGEIDLHAHSFGPDSTVALNGEWLFYPEALLTPEDFSRPESLPPSIRIPVPRSWKKIQWPSEKSPPHFGTYRLLIHTPETTGNLAVRLEDISTAYTLWANGQLLVRNGEVGNTPASEHRNRPFVIVTSVTGKIQTLELVLQVSTFNASEGGITSPILLGKSDALHLAQNQRWGIALWVAGGLTVMGLYHLALFISRRSNRSALYLGIYCLLRVTNAVCSGGSDWVIAQILPGIDGELAFILGMTSLSISLPFLQAFFNSLFPKEFPRQGLLIITAAAGLLTACCLVTRFQSGWPLHALYSYMLLVTAYTLFNLVRSLIRRRSGALILLCGYALLGLAGLNDILTAFEFIHSVWLTPLGTFAFVLSQAFALARHFSRAFSSVEALSIQLEDQNTVLQEEMAERTRLEQELENVSEEERRIISRALHDGLCQELTAARLHCSMLQPPGSTVLSPEIQKLSLLLDRAADQAYELSRGLWPMEHGTQDLATSLNALANQIRSAHPIDVTFRSETMCGTCTNRSATQIYHIAKEAMQNVIKHARASHVSILLGGCHEKKSLRLSIEDNGVGLHAKSASRGGLGTRIMAHRARLAGGTLQLFERPEGGTRVELEIPCTTETYSAAAS